MLSPNDKIDLNSEGVIPNCFKLFIKFNSISLFFKELVKPSEIVKYLIKNKINVMGHVGLLPQKIKSNKDYKIKGRNLRERKKLVDDIKYLEKAGVFSIVLEATSFDAAEDILKHSKVPIIGIGASVNCDGQILVTEDLLGFFDKVPKFVKKYTNLKKQIIKAIGNYAKDVRSRKFPTKQNIYN